MFGRMIPQFGKDAHHCVTALVGSVDTAAGKDHNAHMMQPDEHFSMQDAWERASRDYLARRGGDADAVSYGNLAPTEHELMVLGEVRGLRVLDWGCGGGHNAVACAIAGATVVGVDFSRNQLVEAERLAQSHDVNVTWQLGDEGSLAEFEAASFDVVLAIQVLQYTTDPRGVLQHLARILRPTGKVVISFDHHIRASFFDEADEEFSPFPVRNYDDLTPLRWDFNGQVPMQSLHRPLGQWIEWVGAAGLTVQRVVEALAPPDVRHELWPEDSPLAPLRCIPHTVIMTATRQSG